MTKHEDKETGGGESGRRKTEGTGIIAITTFKARCDDHKFFTLFPSRDAIDITPFGVWARL